MVRPTAFTAGRCRFGLMFCVLVLAALCPAAWADPSKPGPLDRNVTTSVVHFLLRDHLSGHELDDEISRRCFKTFLKTLDPWKLYFYQSDVDSFMERQDHLDDEAREANVSFAYDVFRVFLQRVDERVKLADELLAVEHDFSADEEMVSDRDVARYTRTAAEARDKWRKRIKYDLLMLKVDGKEGQEAREKLTRRYHSFARRMHQTDGEELLEMYLTSLTTAFDPHTSYMSPDTLENFEIAMRLELDGIGASLAAEDGYTVVKKIVPGGAADKHGGLKVEDKIVGVGQGTDGEIVDTVDMKLKDVVKMIRGQRGTVVRLEVVPGDGSKRKVISITRARIELKDSEAQARIFNEDLPFKIGVIKLPSFYMDMEGRRDEKPNYKSTTRDVEKIIKDFRAQGVQALVLDLRGNGGGALTEAINLTGLFIPERGVVVQVKGASGRVHQYRAPAIARSPKELEHRFLWRSRFVLDPEGCWSGPLVVLTSKFSASASEILAGAIQDYHRGLIIGDRATHGKGTVQSLTDLGQRISQFNPPRLGALKITMQQFYRPSGKSTQNRGVGADIELPYLTGHLDVAEADLDYALAYDQVEPLDFEQLDYVNPVICDQLKRRSRQRRENSEEFQKELRKIARYKEQKAKTHITLNEEKFLKQRAELNADKEEEEKLEELNGLSNQPAIKRDFYLDEALAITVDYLNLRQVAKVN